MKTKWFFTVFALFCLQVNGQHENNAVLWKISGNGLSEESHLFGTIHAIPKKQFVMPEPVIKYLDMAKTLMLEIDPKIPISEQVKIAQQIVLPKGKSIKDYMDSTTFVKFKAYLVDSMEIKEDKLNRYFAFKPVFMQTMILMECIDKPKTFEVELKKEAGKKKNFVPLETIQEQMDLLDNIPLEKQLVFEGDNYKLDKEYFQLLDLYLNQDLDGIDSLMFSDPGFKEIEYDLLTKRNINWIPKIMETIAEGSTFIAVGCAHLIGDDGLIELLREEGYVVEPIRD
jgi:hypothetical protein